jgi:hypothetical protein
LIAISAAVVTGLVLLLKSLDANAGIAVAALGIVAVASGAAFGYFADRLPELPRNRSALHVSHTTLITRCYCNPVARSE